MAALIALAFTGLIFWFLFNKPRLRTGGLNGQRVYLRRGPGLGGLVLAIIAFVYLTDHVSAVLSLLLIVVGIAAVLAAMCFGARRLRDKER